MVSENPVDLIYYDGLEVFPKRKNDQRCEAIIRTVKLDRKSLVDTRAEHIEVYWRYRDAVLINGRKKKEVEYYNEWLEESSQPGKKFSFMMKCNFEDWKIRQKGYFVYSVLSKLNMILKIMKSWLLKG